MRLAPGDDIRGGIPAKGAGHSTKRTRASASSLYSTAYNSWVAQKMLKIAFTTRSRACGVRPIHTHVRAAPCEFLTVCVRNEAITRLRSKLRRRKLEERVAAEPQEYDELGAIDVIERDRFRAALRTLPPEQRRPLELAYFEYKTQVEIAHELNEPLGTIKSRIALGLRKLGAALGASE